MERHRGMTCEVIRLHVCTLTLTPSLRTFTPFQEPVYLLSEIMSITQYKAQYIGQSHKADSCFIKVNIACSFLTNIGFGCKITLPIGNCFLTNPRTLILLIWT